MNDARPRTIATRADVAAIEAAPLAEQWTARNVFDLLAEVAEAHPDRPALSFQLKGSHKAPATTLTYAELRRRVIACANRLRALGVGPEDTVAFLLPNLPEAAVILLAGMTSGRVAPINPLLEPEQISALLRATRAKVLVTLKPFVKTDIAGKAAYAVRHAPDCRTVIEVDMAPYVGPPLGWIVPFLAPRRVSAGAARVLSWSREMGRARGDRLEFQPAGGPDDVCAYFHTGGTTGAPKIAAHRHRGAIYNGWCTRRLLLDPGDGVLCPLPLFHVLAAYPLLMGCIASAGHFVMPTPAGYRGAGVMDNFWRLCERWRIKFVCAVPTAISVLMQRKVDADLSSLKYCISGSAPMPVELFRRFEAATGVKLLEGYGQTETTCLISCNPPEGERKIGSVGLPLPYSEVRILRFEPGGAVVECGIDEIGEICCRSPGSIPGYTEPELNAALFAAPDMIRTGDLGRLDADGYLWITGRAKDVIIRGGHNLDPGVIEDALAAHPEVAFVGAIGQPDAHAGELPCAYVELREGADIDPEALKRFAAERVTERAARPAHVEILDELPKTAIGKVYKPELRKRAIARVYGAALRKAGVEAEIEVVDDRRLGLVAEVRSSGRIDESVLAEALDRFARPWRLSTGGSPMAPPPGAPEVARRPQ